MADAAPAPSPDRLIEAYRHLAASAALLNKSSDALSQPIAALDAGLQKLNLGITSWHPFRRVEIEGLWFVSDVGYAKLNGHWGLALRHSIGTTPQTEHDTQEEWLFNDAPRHMRIDAIDHLPDLLLKLSKNAEKTSRKLQAKAEQATQLVTALVQAGVIPATKGRS